MPACAYGFSEYAGQTLRIANNQGIFLDVVWLSTALSPILNHKLERQIFGSDLAKMRDELVHNGVLRQEFAEHLWNREMRGPLVHEGVVGALCRVILDLGVALPLDPPSLLSEGERTQRGIEHESLLAEIAACKKIKLALVRGTDALAVNAGR